VVGPQAEREAVRVFREAAECSERHARGPMEIVRRDDYDNHCYLFG
jgi:hypothetical protein